MVSTLFEIHELSALQQKEKVLIPTYPEKEKKTFEISINRAYLPQCCSNDCCHRTVLCLFNSGRRIPMFKKNNYAQLLPSNFLSK